MLSLKTAIREGDADFMEAIAELQPVALELDVHLLRAGRGSEPWVPGGTLTRAMCEPLLGLSDSLTELTWNVR